jgi:tRNA (guanine37-N1)-methyltransferase
MAYRAVMFAASVITLYPQAFPGPLGVSVLGRAMGQGLWSLDLVDLRDFGAGPHRKVDDTPAGGGAGLVLRADVGAAAIDSVPRDGRPIILPSPRGVPLTQGLAAKLATGPGVILFCGRFEGVDERLIAGRDMLEVCVGDAVLAGGEAAAMVILEAALRLIPGVLGNHESTTEESFSDGLLEHPQYTRPATFEGADIPEIVTSGDHAAVARWRLSERERLTRTRRPDLWRSFQDTKSRPAAEPDS